MNDLHSLVEKKRLEASHIILIYLSFQKLPKAIPKLLRNLPENC